MQAPAWNDVRYEFHFNGSLRDVFLRDTTIEDWQKLLDALSGSCYPMMFLVDGKPNACPTSASEFFLQTEHHLCLLKIDVQGLDVQSYQTTPYEIELTIDPRQITGQSQFDILCNFMQFLATKVNKRVELSDENCRDNTLLFIDSGETEVHYSSTMK